MVRFRFASVIRENTCKIYTEEQTQECYIWQPGVLSVPRSWSFWIQNWHKSGLLNNVEYSLPIITDMFPTALHCEYYLSYPIILIFDHHDFWYLEHAFMFMWSFIICRLSAWIFLSWSFCILPKAKTDHRFVIFFNRGMIYKSPCYWHEWIQLKNRSINKGWIFHSWDLEKNAW